MGAAVPGFKEEDVTSDTMNKAAKEADNPKTDKQEAKQEETKCAGKTKTAQETHALSNTHPRRIFQT